MMGHVVRFILDGRMVELGAIAPDLTLLKYLRTDLCRTGTKEGCGEGDCGACTVVVGERGGHGIDYRAVNACIIFVASLDGKILWTVESLSGADGSLHPVQRALVDHHASQCGFCTPGFVMSLYALYLNTKSSPSLAVINDALAGNLCRCTGYGPIIEAARHMHDYAAPQMNDMEENLALLKQVERLDCLELTSADGRKYFAPRSLSQLGEIYGKNPDTTILAGGTDVGLWVTKQHRILDCVIAVNGVSELNELRQGDGLLHMGAALSYTDLQKPIGALYPDFGEMIRRIGAAQVRNQGSLGGNVANGSPIGDTPPCLIALGAQLHLYSAAGRRQMALEDFFISYGQQDRKAGEVVEKITLPLPGENQVFKAYKLSKRFDQDISALSMALSYENHGDQKRRVRVCYGGMAEIPKRATAAEGLLQDEIWTEDLIQRAMAALEEDFNPISDMRATAAYRMKAAQNLLYKAFLETENAADSSHILEKARHG